MCITRVALALVLSMSMLMPPGRHIVLLADARPAFSLMPRRRRDWAALPPASVEHERVAGVR